MGTDRKVRLFDPASGMHIEIGASGEFNIRNRAEEIVNHEIIYQ